LPQFILKPKILDLETCLNPPNSNDRVLRHFYLKDIPRSDIFILGLKTYVSFLVQIYFQIKLQLILYFSIIKAISPQSASILSFFIISVVERILKIKITSWKYVLIELSIWWWNTEKRSYLRNTSFNCKTVRPALSS